MRPISENELPNETAANPARRVIRYSGAAAASALSIGAAASFYPPLEAYGAAMAAMALPALGFVGGSFLVNVVPPLRRPRAHSVAVLALAPVAPLLPSFATLLVAGIFLALGLFLGRHIDGVVRAFARERVASVVGGVGMLAIAAFAALSSFAMVQMMPFWIGLSATVATIALASVAGSEVRE